MRSIALLIAAGVFHPLITCAQRPVMFPTTAPVTLQGDLTAITDQNVSNFYKANNIFYVDGVHYPMTGAGVQSALADAITAGGGTVDATGVIGATFSSEMDVGNSSNVPIVLLVPAMGNWTSTVSDGLHAGFKIYNLSHIVGRGCGAGLQFQMIGASTFNGTNVFLTDSRTNYTHLAGFAIALAQGGKVSSAIGEFQGFQDNSLVECVNVANYRGTLAHVPKVGYVHNMCCNATFRNVEYEGQNGATGRIGSVPLTIGNSTDTTSDVIFDTVNAVHPADGQSNIVVTGALTKNIIFLHSVYMEKGSGTDTTTPAFQAGLGTGGDPVYIEHLSMGADNASSTRFAFDNASTGGRGQAAVRLVTQAVSNNCINDHVTGVIVTGCLPDTLPKGFDSTTNTLLNQVLTTPTLSGAVSPSAMRLKLSDQGQCTMSSGTCTSSFASTYTNKPLCFANWTGAGTLAGSIKVSSTQSAVTVDSSVNKDSAQVNWICFGN